MENELKDKPEKSKKKKRIIIGILITLCALILFGTLYFYNTFNQMKQVKLDKNDLEIKTEVSSKLEADKINTIVNIALFGVDEAENDTGRSDAIMIGTLDPINNKLKVSSLMRDCYVDIPDHKFDKLNHAYAYGGPELALKTINKNFDLNITDYVKINFEGLQSVVDVLGGVDLDLTYDEYIAVNQYIKKVSYSKGIPEVLIPGPGMQHLSGFQTLGYCRIRNIHNGDFDRTQRHRIVINAILNKVAEGGVTKLPSIISQIMPYVETSLSPSQIFKLGINVLNIGNTDIEQQRFPLDAYCENTLIDNIFYIKYDEEKTKEDIYEYIFNDIKIWESRPSDSGSTNYTSISSD